jgi:hypothetical protein
VSLRRLGLILALPVAVALFGPAAQAAADGPLTGTVTDFAGPVAGAFAAASGGGA